MRVNALERHLARLRRVDVDVRARPAGCVRNSGLTSSTTRYWFNCVNMIEICRWPKASYSVSSIICGVMPSREAVSRSITTRVCRPSFCWSLATSRSCGKAFELGDQLAAPTRSVPWRRGLPGCTDTACG